MSFTNLGCQNWGLTNPVSVVVNGAGAATEVMFNTTPQTASDTAGAGGTASTGQAGTGQGLPVFQLPDANQRMGHQLMNPSGM
jgi:hypothetical protein